MLCTSCRRREALYYHKTSGNYFCEKCFTKLLVKNVRKAFSLYNLVATLNPNIIFFFDGCLPLESFAGLLVLSQAEKGFTKYIDVLLPVELAELEEVLRKALWKSPISIGRIFNYDLSILSDITLAERVRGVRLLASLVLRKVREELNKELYVALPYTRSHILAMFLDALLSGHYTMMSDLTPRSKAKKGIIVMIPFYEITAEDLLAYALVKKVNIEVIENAREKSRHLCKNIGTPALELIESTILTRGSELVYSFTRTLNKLTNAIENDNLYSRCMYCGGLEYKIVLKTKGVCRTCNRIFSYKQDIKAS